LARACDIVLEQGEDGRLSVSGRALPQTVTVRTRDEVRSLLRALPQRGSAIARVKEPTKPREIHVGPPRSPAARQAQGELTQLLVEEGFTIARAPGPKLLPVGRAPKRGRPSSR
jgi:hypothetical protein